MVKRQRRVTRQRPDSIGHPVPAVVLTAGWTVRLDDGSIAEIVRKSRVDHGPLWRVVTTDGHVETEHVWSAAKMITKMPPGYLRPE